jgi:hypothetical protein
MAIPTDQIDKEMMVTAGTGAHSIAYMRAWTGVRWTDTSGLQGGALTRRRAVDFCRVAAALCRVSC